MAYHVLIDGEQTGPHETSAVVEMIGRGEVTADTLVWGTGMPDWVPAGDVAELRSHLGGGGGGFGSRSGPSGHAIPVPGDGMPGDRLSIGQAFSQGFATVFGNLPSVLVLMIVYFAVGALGIVPYLAALFAGGGFSAEPSGGSVLFIVVAYLFSLAIYASLYGGLSWSMLRAVRGEPFGLGTLFAGFARIVPLFLFFLIYMILVTVGMIALVIPGIFLAVALILGPFLIMDRRVGPIAAVRGSFRAVMAVGWWRTFAVLLLFFVVIIAITLIVVLGLGAGAMFMSASDPTAGGGSVAGIVAIVVVELILGAIIAVLFSAILGSIFHQAEPSLTE